MTKLYFEPIEVEWADGRPQTFTWRRPAAPHRPATPHRPAAPDHPVHHITTVLKRWIVCVEWWRQEVSRQYYQVQCEDLGTYEIYCERGHWFLERVYD